MLKNHGYYHNTNRLIANFPDYVNEYIQSQRTIPLSHSTLYSYCLEFKKYLQWLIESEIISHESIKEITLKELENISKHELEDFVLQERLRLETKMAQGNMLQP
jgi:hypothetical protein